MGCNWSKRNDSKESQQNLYNESESESDYVSNEIDKIFVATSKSAVLCVDAATTSTFWTRRSAGVNVSAEKIPDWEGTGESFGIEERSKTEISEITAVEAEAEIPKSSPESPTIQRPNTSPVVSVQSVTELPLFKLLTHEKSRSFSNILECNMCYEPAKGYCIHCGLKRYCKNCYDENHDGLKHSFMNYKLKGKIDRKPSPLKNTPKI